MEETESTLYSYIFLGVYIFKNTELLKRSTEALKKNLSLFEHLSIAIGQHQTGSG